MRKSYWHRYSEGTTQNAVAGQIAAGVIMEWKMWGRKTIIDGEKNCVRVAIQMQKGGKYYYNLEVNKKPTPGRSKA